MKVHRSDAAHRQPPWRAATPREAALQILAFRFPEEAGAISGGDGHQSKRPICDVREDSTGHDRTAPVFTLAGFQRDAVRRAHRILAERRGVLIADSVGLGKTFIALGLIEDALRGGDRVGVVTPAALRRDWVAPLRKAARALHVRETRGLGLDDGGGSSTRHHHRTPFLAWTSDTRLGRGIAPAELHLGLDLIVVDEAHAFRNPRTQRYRALAELSRSARLVLITATPVNNSLTDLYALIRLFAGDGDFRDLGIPDLAETIRVAKRGPDAGRAMRSLQPVLRALMIRRTREIVREAEPPSTAPRFPHRAPPTPIRYALDSVYAGFLPELTATLATLTLAPFRLASYGASTDGASMTAPAELIRLGLLKRLESSLAALRISITRQLRLYEACLDSLGRGLLRLPAEDRAQRRRGTDDALQLALEELTLRPIPPDLDRARLHDDLAADHERLHYLHSRLTTLRSASDPKLERLLDLLNHELRGEKIIVFTEFRETARYLWRELCPRGGVGLIDGGGAFLGRARAGRQEVIARFAPHANHSPPPPPHERVDLLLATDVLAEGLNLQDARHVISYDLPWNPVRLIQRIGRVDRIASPHDVVFPYHFLPDQGLEELLRIVRRLRAKTDTIRGTIGEEFMVVAETDSGTDTQTIGGMKRLARGQGGHGLSDLPIGTDESLRAAYHRALIGTPSPKHPPTAIPVAIVAAPPGATHRTLIACRIGRQLVFLVHTAAQGVTVEEDDVIAAEILLAALRPEGTAPPLTPDPRLLRQGWRVARSAAANRLALSRAAEPLPAKQPGARAARTLLSLLAASPGDPEPDLCRRIDKLLPLLARRHDAGTEASILGVLRQFETSRGLGSHRQTELVRGARTPGGTGAPPRTSLSHDPHPASNTSPILTLIQALEDVLPIDHSDTSAATPSSTIAPEADDVALVGMIEYRPSPKEQANRATD